MRIAQQGDMAALAEAFRRLVFEKGTECHAYKYSAAMFAESRYCHPALAPRVLAAGAFYLPVGGTGQAEIYRRARAALK